MMDKFCLAIEKILFQLNMVEKTKEIITLKIDITLIKEKHFNEI